MPGETRTENSYVGMKLQHRWEKKYPKLRCVMTEDPDKRTGASLDRAIGNKSRLEGKGYRVIPMTDEERLLMMDRADFILLGRDAKEHQAELDERAAASKRPLGDVELTV